MNNEFAEDLKSGMSRDRDQYKERAKQGGSKVTTLVGVETSSGVRGESSESKPKGGGCDVCSGKHRIWKCTKFRELSYKERKKIVYESGLCMRCLGSGHYARDCDKKHFKCLHNGCGKEHHSLLHPPNNEVTGEREGVEGAMGGPSPVGVSETSNCDDVCTTGHWL